MSELRITTPDQKHAWSCSLTPEEVEKVREYAKNSSECSRFFGLIFPIRTSDLNYLNDLFLPTYLSTALKIENAVLKKLAAIGLICIDLVTVPIRLITSAVRVLWNACKSEHPLHKFIREKNADKDILNAERVIATIKWSPATHKQSAISHWTDESGAKHYQPEMKNSSERRNVNFIDVPAYDKMESESSVEKGVI